MKMLDNSVTDNGSTRRRSTFYVPLTETVSNNNQENKNSSMKKSFVDNKNNLTGFSPFWKTPKKSFSPPTVKNQEGSGTTLKKIPLTNSLSVDSSSGGKLINNKIIQQTPGILRGGIPGGGKITHLQKPQQKPSSKAVDTAKLLKTSSVSVPSLDNTFALSVVKNSSTSTQSLETLVVGSGVTEVHVEKQPTTKTTNLFLYKKANQNKVTRSPSQTLTVENLVKKVTLSNSNVMTTTPTISQLQTPPKDFGKFLNVPQITLESEDTDDSEGFKKNFEESKNLSSFKCVGGDEYNDGGGGGDDDDDDCGMHSGRTKIIYYEFKIRDN